MKLKTLSSSHTIFRYEPNYEYLKHLENIILTLKPKSENASRSFESIILTCKSIEKKYPANFSHSIKINERIQKITEDLPSNFEVSENSRRKIIHKIKEGRTQKQILISLINEIFDIKGLEDGGLFWIEAYESGLKANFLHIDDLLRLNENQRIKFLEESLSKLVSEKNNSSNFYGIFEPMSNYEMKRMGLKIENAELFSNNVVTLHTLIFQYIKDKYKKSDTKLIVKNEGLNFNFYIPGIEQEIKMTPKEKSLYALTLLNPLGIPIIKLEDYQNDLLRIYSKIKSSESDGKLESTIDNLVKKVEELRPTKSHTSNKIKKNVESIYPNNKSICDLIANDLSYIKDGQILKLPISLKNVDDSKIIESLRINPILIG